MANSDRTQFKQVVAGAVASLRTLVTNPLQGNGCVAQDAQRYASVACTTGLANNVSPNIQVVRVDRPIQVKECRILPGAALTQDTGNLVISYGYTNDNGGSFTTMGTINTNTAANGGTGNWSAYQSVLITANTSVNAVVPSGSHFGFKVVNSGAGLAVPSGTAFQVIWEEV